MRRIALCVAATLAACVIGTGTQAEDNAPPAAVCSVHADGSIHAYTDHVGVQGREVPCP